MEFHLFDHRVVRPLLRWGFTGSFWDINLDTILFTWLALSCLSVSILLIRYVISGPDSVASHAIESGFRFLMDWTAGSIGYFDRPAFICVLGLSLFTLFCNIIDVFPFVEAATSDVNTTLAIGTSSFCYVQYRGMKRNRLAYFTKYFSPIFVFFPINVLGQLSKIASLSFRLFGNVLAGSIILSMLFGIIDPVAGPFLIFSAVTLLCTYLFYHFVCPEKHPHIKRCLKVAMGCISFIPGSQIVFSIFHGGLQAIVIGLLTTMYLSSEISLDSQGGH